jgi:hypothetical protein
MSLHSYRPLSDEAFKLLERDAKVRRTFLDFLAVLQDVVANAVPLPEAPFFSEEEQAKRSEGLARELPKVAQLQATALENREKAYALDGQDGPLFLGSLLNEYNRIRVLWANPGGVAAHA